METVAQQTELIFDIFLILVLAIIGLFVVQVFNSINKDK